jgi:hypothetical protein
MQRRAPQSGLILTIAIAIGCGLHCDQVDEDPRPVLAHLAGPGATDCGTANGHTGIGSPDDVRACMIVALHAHDPFSASASPDSADGSITIGWASDGERFWRVKYLLMDGCSPVSYDSLDQEPCESLVDLGDACDSLAEDLCFACGAP